MLEEREAVVVYDRRVELRLRVIQTNITPPSDWSRRTEDLCDILYRSIVERL